MEKKKIAVIVAVCNGEKYLKAQLNSIVAQTTLPDILLIADDRSADHSFDILKRFENSCQIDCKVLLNERRLGVTANFQQLMYQALDSDYIFLADQDDVWFPNKIEEMTKKLDEGAGLVFCDATIIDADGVSDGETWFERIQSHGGTERAFGLGCTTAITGKLLRSALPIPKGLGHDMWLHFVAANLGCRVMLAAALMKYRVHQGGHSKSKNKNKVTDGQQYLRRRALKDRVARNLPLVAHHARKLIGLSRAYIKYHFTKPKTDTTR